MGKRKRDWNDLSPINGGQEVKRRAFADYYQQRRMKGLTDTDLLASQILALIWSERTDDPTGQGLIQTACVATSIEPSGIYIGSNYLSKTKVTTSLVQSILSTEAPGCYTQNVVISDNSDDKKHAEMQIVEKLWNVYGNLKALRDANIFIGVSKPCCPKCSNVLDFLKIGYTTKHADIPNNWLPPNIPTWG